LSGPQAIPDDEPFSSSRVGRAFAAFKERAVLDADEKSLFAELEWAVRDALALPEEAEEGSLDRSRGPPLVRSLEYLGTLAKHQQELVEQIEAFSSLNAPLQNSFEMASMEAQREDDWTPLTALLLGILVSTLLGTLAFSISTSAAFEFIRLLLPTAAVAAAVWILLRAASRNRRRIALAAALFLGAFLLALEFVIVILRTRLL